VGLPPGTTKTMVCQIAELLSLRSDDVKFADVLRSRGGIPTDKGIKIFKIAPVMLLNKTTFTWAGNRLIFYWMDRDVQCEHCHCVGHSMEACPSVAYDSLDVFEELEAQDDPPKG